MVRVLLVTDEWPWPTRSGYRQRLDRVVRALAAAHELDLVVATSVAAERPPPPQDVRVRRVHVVVAPYRAEGPVVRVTRWLRGRLPRTLAYRDWREVRAAVAAVAAEDYDAVWFSHAGTWAACSDLLRGSARVVDLDNLDSFLEAHRLQAMALPRGVGLRRRAAGLARLAAHEVDRRRWRRLERAVRDGADAVLVCSELDRRRLAGPRVRVVENGYEPGARHAVARPTTPGPVFVLVGLLTYEPNRDAATFFAGQVLPLLRESLPDAELHVVGRYAAPRDVAGFVGQPGVRVKGEVPDVVEELARARAVVVPVRFGGGTRIKILEAFALGLPVVSTTVGAEGLEVVPGEHLLVADDPASFAAACAALHHDAALRERVSAAGHELWSRRYRWSLIEPAILSAVDEAVAASSER